MSLNQRRRGYTLLEVLIVAAVSAVVLAAVFTVLFTTVRQDEGLRVRMEMQLEAARAMKEITSLLKMSGALDVNRNLQFDAGSDWPVFVTDELAFEPRPPEGAPLPPGNFPPPLSEINTEDTDPATARPALTPPYKLSRENDNRDFPENQASVELAFRLPEDGDGDGYVTDSSGNIEWSDDVYVLCHEARSPVEWLESGNVLELRRYDSTTWKMLDRRVLANWVERVLFESQSPQIYQTENYDPTLGFDQIRVTIWFRRSDVSRQRERQIAFKQVSTVLFRSVDR